jgi:hypothetical protein
VEAFMHRDGRAFVEECRRAIEAVAAEADAGALRAEAGRLRTVLADPAH